jgi:hypothetical protein
VYHLETMSDPVQPPPSGRQRAGVALYSIQGIVVGTFLGSLAAAVVMLYLNYRALGREHLAKTVSLWGAGLFVAVMVVASFVPFNLAFGLLFAIGQAAIAFLVADRLQGDAIRYHRETGGLVHSTLRGAGVGFLTGMVMFFISLNIAAIMMGLSGPEG